MKQATPATQARPGIPDRAGTLGSLLRATYQHLQARLYGELADTFPEIRPSHSSVFRHIAPEGSRLTDLAQQAELTKQSMAYLVKDLTAHGCLETRPHPDDGRASLVVLTPRGQAVVDLALEISARIEREAASHLEPGEMSRLRTLLGRLAESMRAEG